MRKADPSCGTSGGDGVCRCFHRTCSSSSSMRKYLPGVCSFARMSIGSKNLTTKNSCDERHRVCAWSERTAFVRDRHSKKAINSARNNRVFSKSWPQAEREQNKTTRLSLRHPWHGIGAARLQKVQGFDARRPRSVLVKDARLLRQVRRVDCFVFEDSQVEKTDRPSPQNLQSDT